MRVVNLTSRKAAIIRFGVSIFAFCAAAAVLAQSDSGANGDTAVYAETLAAGANAEADFAKLPADDSAAITLQSQDPAQDPAPITAASPAPFAPKPINLRIVASQFVDVPVSGDARSVARYAGRVDGYLEVQGGTLGGPSNLTLKIRPEYTWGETSNGAVGLIPGNTALFRPEGSGDFDLSASAEYRWNSGATLEVGKINLLDITGKLPIVASDGHFGFQNLGLALPPTAIAPNTITGAALLLPKGKMIYRLWVYDVDSQYQRTGLEDPFANGIGFLAAAAVRTQFAGKPGFFNFAVVGSTRDTFARDLLPSALTPPQGGAFGDESGELAVQLSAYQYVELYPEAPGKGWGILARFQASMGDPTFLDYSGYFGVSGNPRFRMQDRFGLAYFHYSLTDELVDDIAFRLGLEDEEGVEAFYTYGFAQGFGVTASVQVVDSAIAFRDTGVTLGARLTAEF